MKCSRTAGCIAVFAAAILTFLVDSIGAQAPPTAEPSPAATPAPAAADADDDESEEAGEKEPQPSEEEFKEDVPTNADDKARKEEIERKACPKVDVKFSADTDKKQHPTPEAPPDKALVYVLRPTRYGGKIQSKLAIDGQWVGLNRGKNYFFVTLDPGEHYFCSKAENRSTMALKVQAGKTYYVEQKIRMGIMKARNKLAMMTEEQGKAKLPKCHPSSWKEKK